MHALLRAGIVRVGVACTSAAPAACSVDRVTFTPLPEESCTDAMKNGDEADVDCGGGCPTCRDGAACGANGDCDSGLCGAATCVRLPSCAAILAGGFSIGDGNYSIDPDGAGGEPAFLAKCNMTTDGGGWTRFNWVTGAYPAGMDPLEQALSQCAVTDVICRARIPASEMPGHFMVKDLGDGHFALWRFEASNAVSNAVLHALRDKTTNCVAQQVPWQPYEYSGAGSENFCGTGGEGGCDSFVYANINAGCPQAYAGWYVQLDGDTGCYNAAFKIGMTHAGLEGAGCDNPDVNYLDDGPSTLDDTTGELYYR